MGDVNQLSPVAMKSIADDFNLKTSCSTDSICKISLSEFINPPNELETVNFTFHLTNIVRQRVEVFKDILSSTRNRT